MHENPRAVAIIVAERLIHDVEHAIVQYAVAMPIKFRRYGIADERLTRVENAVEQIEEWLAFELRKRLTNGSADHIASVEQSKEGAIRCSKRCRPAEWRWK